MENHYPPVIEKSIKVIQRFEEKFGWFAIRVYQFPQVEGFGTFLESVQRTLLRHGTAVWYIWAKIRGTDKILLIYFGRVLWAGHFEQETDAIIPRLWQRQASVPYMVADTITVNQQNKNDLSDWLVRYLIATGAPQTANANWHKKTFGSAQHRSTFVFQFSFLPPCSLEFKTKSSADPKGPAGPYLIVSLSHRGNI